jgi:hypothetical protein
LFAGKARLLALAAILSALIGVAYVALNYQEIVHGSAILRAVDPGWPAWKNTREIVAIDQDGTHAQVQIKPIVSCANPVGHYFDIWLVRRDGWWWLETVKQGSYAVADCW